MDRLVDEMYASDDEPADHLEMYHYIADEEESNPTVKPETTPTYAAEVRVSKLTSSQTFVHSL